jgi:hypothetical protein
MNKTKAMTSSQFDAEMARVISIEIVPPEFELRAPADAPRSTGKGMEAMTNSYVKTASKPEPQIASWPSAAIPWPGVATPWPGVATPWPGVAMATPWRARARVTLGRIANKISGRLVAATMALIGYEPKIETKADDHRIVLPMSSGMSVPRNTSAQITSRPQNVSFRPTRIVIGGVPGDWIVNDIKVGNRSQLSQSGDLPGELFAFDAVDTQIKLDTVFTAMDFVLLVTYVGSEEKGMPFICGVIGDALI